MEKLSTSTPALAAGITIESTSSTTSILKPVITTNQVRIVKKAEYKAAALCLAEAFVADDVSRYFIDTPDRADWSEADKWDLHLSIMEYVVLAHCLKGLVTTVGPNYDCVALWWAPLALSFLGSEAIAAETLLAMGTSRRAILTFKPRNLGCRQARPWTIGARSFGVVSGDFDTSFPPRARTASSASSCRYCTTRSTTSSATATTTPGTSSTSALKPPQEGKAMLEN